MPRTTKTANLRKVCGCVKWKACTHPWYLDHQRKGKRLRVNLDKLLGRHPADYVAAVDDGRRALAALLAGHNPAGIVPADNPTLGQILDEYGRRTPRVARWEIPRLKRTPVASAAGVARRFGDWPVSTITPDTLQTFRAARPHVAGNRDLELLRAACNLAVLHGRIARSPFRVGHVPAVRLERAPARSRRLQPGEAESLLAAAGRLQDTIVAAIETGCRLGELLSLQWHQVRFDPAEIFLPAPKTKTRRDRRVPMSSVLRRVLQARRKDPAGDELPPDAYVFGDEVGRRRRTIKTAWGATCRRAKIKDLHFHDLRREAGSRWMDAGISLATIQRWLGHTNISQTSTYLAGGLGADERDMQAYEQRVGRLDGAA
jgi:integrase